MNNARDMWTSISAFEDAFGKDCKGGCLRRWAFRKIFKLPEPVKAATVFGDVFHAVLARFYMADDRGLGADGKPVDLFPEGWQSMKSRFGKADGPVYTITKPEEALIRVLVDEAIAKGILCRVPGRVVEREISRPIFTDTSGVHPRQIVLKGFVDLETPRSIEDHKTAKKTEKPYTVPAKELNVNVQLMTYAWDKYERGHTGTLWIAHNNFIKDPNKPQVVRREAEVTEEQVYIYFFDEILPRFQKMLEIFKKYPPKDVTRWRELPSPNNPEDECNHHFGQQCPFVSICSGTCELGLYLEKYKDNRLLEQPTETITEEKTNTEKGSKLMNLIDKIKGNIASIPKAAPAPVPAQQTAVIPQDPTLTTPTAQTAPAPAPQLSGILATVQAKMNAAKAATAAPAPVAPAAPAPAAPVVQALDKPKAPWYTPHMGQHCPACKDNDVLGYNSKGEPCRICDARANSEGRPTSIDYDVIPCDDGTLSFVRKTTPAPAPAAPAKAPAVKATAVKKEKAETKVQTAAPAAPVVQAPAAPAPVQAQKAAANPGFTLMIGCALTRSNGTKLVDADALLRDAIAYLEQVSGKSVAELGHFALVEALDAYIPQIANNLVSGEWVMSYTPGKGTALARLVDGLRPYASRVIAPLV